MPTKTNIDFELLRKHLDNFKKKLNKEPDRLRSGKEERDERPNP